MANVAQERHTRHSVRELDAGDAAVRDPEPPIAGQRDVEKVTDQHLEDRAVRHQQRVFTGVSVQRPGRCCS